MGSLQLSAICLTSFIDKWRRYHTGTVIYATSVETCQLLHTVQKITFKRLAVENNLQCESRSLNCLYSILPNSGL